MTDVWHDSAAIAPVAAPPPPSGDHHRRGRTKWVVVTAVVVVVLAAASYVGVRAWDSFRQSFANIGSGFANLGRVMESGGTASNAAASLAAPLPPGLLSVSTLNAKLPSYQWVDGATNVPYSSSQRPIVGVSATGDSCGDCRAGRSGLMFVWPHHHLECRPVDRPGRTFRPGHVLPGNERNARMCCQSGPNLIVAAVVFWNRRTAVVLGHLQPNS